MYVDLFVAFGRHVCCVSRTASMVLFCVFANAFVFASVFVCMCARVCFFGGDGVSQ